MSTPPGALQGIHGLSQQQKSQEDREDHTGFIDGLHLIHRPELERLEMAQP